MIPIVLITGFLGSGKTTLISRLYQQNTSHPYVYLINEFSSIDIDGQRLTIPKNQLISIPGGSIFCRCLVSDFIRILGEIESSRESRDHKCEGVIIEASGIADPNVIQQLLHETKLDQQYELKNIIGVIDAGTFGKLIHTLPNITRQVQASHILLLNKTDLYTEMVLQQTEETLREINPSAKIIRTQYCETTLDLFSGTTGNDLSGDYALCRDPNYISISLQHDVPIDWPRLKSEIEDLPGSVYRVKGYVQTPESTIEADYASGVWNENRLESETDPRTTRLVIIAEGRYEMGIHQVQSKMKQHEYDIQ